MGIFAIFDIYINSDINEIMNFIIYDIVAKNKVRTYENFESILNRSIRENYNNCNVTFDAFNASITKLGNDDINFKREIYDLIFNYNFYFELYRKSEDRDSEMMKFLGFIMRKYLGDCVLTLNTVTVLIRKDEEIIVDETDTKRIKMLPYNLLELPVKLGKIDV